VPVSSWLALKDGSSMWHVRRAARDLPHTRDGALPSEPHIVSIDVSEISFT
jgi:hypothetical protein